MDSPPFCPSFLGPLTSAHPHGTCIQLQHFSKLGLLCDPCHTTPEGEENPCFFCVHTDCCPLRRKTNCTHHNNQSWFCPLTAGVLGTHVHPHLIIYALSVFLYIDSIFIQLNCSSVIFWPYNVCLLKFTKYSPQGETTTKSKNSAASKKLWVVV